ncbi:LolA family protein [Texcoconibacillus texcoconensis]|uniref:Outer membrane lipoprotein-sorting protein n=1 Tax=Texcoconibacillus texcoconensis TaxID=1095777 RepID=A0A840QRU7_9BACI|nr:outer membrane lipoprotein carrier protein LolA [Texcoconibacillus texcoconensis]MBB5174216.1 outer membrane lipoprotein-sorting protein [Texcoconibacillus texcoconensis]
MKRSMTFVMFLAVAVLTLAGCGEKTQEDVIGELEDRLESMSGYKAEAQMTLETGEEPQTYDVEVWHDSPSFYRVALNNAEKDQQQIILRNDEGVFVLTPALNKSFRFQSDWPENNSQVYLYESLINDILVDPERTFTATDDEYIFQTNTNYTNKNLNQQEIALDKKDLAPNKVQVMDPDLDVLVEIEFEGFEVDASFNEADFDMDRNMAGAQLNMEEIPTLAEEGSEEPFNVLYPTYQPQGTSLEESQEIETEDGERVILSYDGDDSFTLVQQRSQAVDASTPMHISEGDPIDLGFAIGALSRDGDNKTISWSYQGADFFLASQTLSDEELATIARSVYGSEEK